MPRSRIVLPPSQTEALRKWGAAIIAEKQRMIDTHVFAEWQAHYAGRDYSVIIKDFSPSQGRPLPSYDMRMLRTGGFTRG